MGASGMLLKRVLDGAITLVVVVCLTFFLMRLLPGGPFDKDRKVPPEVAQQLEARFHLNEPVLNQFGYYVAGLARGDLGPSYTSLTRRVNDIVAEGGGVSFVLGVGALAVGISLGGFLGIAAVVARRPWVKVLATLPGVVSLSMPTFIWGALLVLVFAYGLNWLPAARIVSPRHFILPILALSLTPFAYTFMLLKTATQEVLEQPFIGIKRAFGLPDTVILTRHTLRLALLPLVSILGPMSAMVVTGSFAVELIFAVPGLGRYFITSVINRDYTVVLGITLVYSALLILFNLVTDSLTLWLDPRLQEAGRGQEGP